MNTFEQRMKSKWQMIMLIAVITAAVVFTISAFIPPKYRSDITFLVIQKQASSKVDAFSAAKSAEYLSDILSRVIYSEAFIEDVTSSPIETRDFSADPEDRKEEWQKMLNVKKVNNTGIINVTVFDKSRDEAAKTAEAIAWALSVRGHKYHGGGERVVVRVIDGPITSAKPAQPNIFLNTLMGFVIGLGIALVVVYFFPDTNLKIIDGEKRKTKKSIDEKLEEELKEEYPESLSEINKMGKVDVPYEVIPPREEMAEKSKEKKAEKSPEGGSPSGRKESEKVERVSRVKKSAAPDNLPIFNDQQKDASATEVAHGYAPKREEPEEASEEEVKERLNRLLKGDI